MYEIFNFNNILGDMVGRVIGLVYIHFILKKNMCFFFCIFYNHWINKETKIKTTLCKCHGFNWYDNLQIRYRIKINKHSGVYSNSYMKAFISYEVLQNAGFRFCLMNHMKFYLTPYGWNVWNTYELGKRMILYLTKLEFLRDRSKWKGRDKFQLDLRRFA